MRRLLCLTALFVVVGLPFGCATDQSPPPDEDLKDAPPQKPPPQKVAAHRPTVRTPRPLKTGAWEERRSRPTVVRPTPLRIAPPGPDWPVTPAATAALPRFEVGTKVFDRAPNVPAKVTILLQRNKQDRSPRYLIYDLAAQAVRFEADAVWPPAASFPHLLYAGADDVRHVYDLLQGQVLTPDALLPAQRTPRAMSLAMHAKTGRVMYLATTHQDETFLGFLPADQPGPVVFDVAVPFSAHRSFGSTATVPSPYAWDVFQRQHRLAGSPTVVNEGKSCPLLSVDQTLGPVCRPHPDDMNSEKLVDERYRIDGPFVFDDVERVAYKLGAECPRGAHIIGHWADPVRVLAACLIEDRPWFELWSPEKSLRFSAFGDISTFRILKDPVRGLRFYRPGQPSTRGPWVEVFIDLPRMRVFTGGRFVPLPFSESFGHRRVMLATVDDHPQELWRIDLEHGTAGRVTADHGCAYPPHHVAETDTRMLLSCIHHKSIFIDGPRRRRATRFSEVVDLEKSKRTRYGDLTLPAFADAGRMVVGNPQKDGRRIVVAPVP